MVFRLLLSFLWLCAAVSLFGYAFTGERNPRGWIAGIAPLTILLTLFSTLGLPLHWLIILAIAAIAAAVRHFKFNAQQPQPQKPQQQKAGLMPYIISPDTLAIIAVLFTVYLLFSGSMAYHYLEDDDPWVHALGVTQVAQTLSANRPALADPSLYERWYLEPYPPAFDILLGLLRQLNDSTYFTLKFFNALLCGAAVFAFYLWLREAFPERPWLPAIAALFISITPGFMSHFIWAQTLAIITVFLALLALTKLSREPNSLWQAVICVAAVLVAQPTVAITFGAISGLFLVSQLALRKFDYSKNIFIALVAGLALALLIFWVPMYLKFGPQQFVADVGIDLSYLSGGTSSDTSGGAVYDLGTFLFPPSSSKIDQAEGLGIGLVLLSLAAAFIAIRGAYRGKPDAILVFLVLFMVFGYVGTEGNALPVKLFPHRFWVFLAMPVAALAAYAITLIPRKMESLFFTSPQGAGAISEGATLSDASGKAMLSKITSVKRSSEGNEIRFRASAAEFPEDYIAKPNAGGLQVYVSSSVLFYVAIAIIVAMLFFTSLSPRMAVQTATWPPGTMWSSMDELQGYFYLNALQPGTKVFPLCSPDSKVIGFDMLSEPWNAEYRAFKRAAFNKTPDEVYAFIKPRGYQFVIVDATCLKVAGGDAAQAKLGDYAHSPNYSLQNSSAAVFVFKVN